MAIMGFFGSARSVVLLGLLVLTTLSVGLLPEPAAAQESDPEATQPERYGPYNARVIAAGPALVKALPGHLVGDPQSGLFARPPQVTLLPETSNWTLHGWFRVREVNAAQVVFAGIGDPASSQGRFLGLANGRAALWVGSDMVATGGPAVARGEWLHLAAANDDGAIRLYANGQLVAQAEASSANAAIAGQAIMGPRGLPGDNWQDFSGEIANLVQENSTLSLAEIVQLHSAQPDFSLTRFEEASRHWEVSTRQMTGQLAPQDAWTLPRGQAEFSTPIAVPRQQGPALEVVAPSVWRLARWQMAEGPDVGATGAEISSAGFDSDNWHQATVPGTVLTTLVDSGVYPDPDYGLNNMAIPESLNRQHYWYRTRFDAPSGQQGNQPDGQRLTLTFNGINYAAEIWLNGERLGELHGAFQRGSFDAGQHLREHGNVLAVRISPPTHPGLAHEASITAGPGDNGGMQALDGPTFIATEGWDWIPSVRDRNSGLWQDVLIEASGPVTIGDAAVITTLPLPDNSRADLEIEIPLTNHSGAAINVSLTASFGNVELTKTLSLDPGEQTLRLDPSEFPQLSIADPELWWPNGYGDPLLHELRLSVAANGVSSDSAELRFGMREISYEISLVDEVGDLRRVEYRPTLARAEGRQAVDVRHEAMRQVQGDFSTWASSFAQGAEEMAAFSPAPESGVSPSLIIKVNGVRIAARGGNWGMDDWRKRISRDRLEPYFRLTREANLNMIRNWQGQSTGPVFYDLADEYGILLVNDFWESTQSYNLEASDTQLFLDNASDTISRYRHHPSIAIWIGRNEGVPQPAIHDGLEQLVREIDGTRYYNGASNFINFGLGGPYAHEADPAFYFTYDWGRGFTMEVGLPSFPTLEAFEAMIPEEDRWPISDAWAYHDWHQAGNGDTHSFMEDMTARFGEPLDLADFERKAQLMNYEAHRAVFEGFNAGLWTRTSGRLMWMGHPAWPSMVWQIYSSDYDANAAYYGVRAASEQVHAQINRPGNEIALVNNRNVALAGVRLVTQVLALDGATLDEQSEVIDLPANGVTTLAPLDLAAVWNDHEAVLIQLQLHDQSGEVLSNNLYWRTRTPEAGRALTALEQQAVTLDISSAREGEESVIHARLRNSGDQVALNAKLTLLDAEGQRILPAYYSDNYISLLPGESRELELRIPGPDNLAGASFKLSGWNVVPVSQSVVSQGE